MRRTTIVALVAAMLLALSGVAALAAGISCSGGFCAGTDEDDSMTGTSGFDRMFAFGGNDTLSGQDGGDELHGGEGNDEFPTIGFGGYPDAEPGADTFYGGPGKDIIWARKTAGQLGASLGASRQLGEDSDPDKVDCGAGDTDWAIYDGGEDVVNKANCERRDWTDEELPSCAPRPWDNASVKCFDGTKRSEKLLGRDDPDPRMVDVIWARGGNDELRGRHGYNWLVGGIGGDTIVGGPRDDALFSHNVEMFDDVPPGEGHDTLIGGDGDDFFDAVDGSSDTISCGGGDDWAEIDPNGLDTIMVPTDCEQIFDHNVGIFHWVHNVVKRRR
jgi:hypothetical protein